MPSAQPEVPVGAATSNPAVAEHSPDQYRPLASYGLLSGVFASLCGVFVAWVRWSGRDVPARIEGRDLALIAVATHKASRLIARDRVTSVFRAPFTRFQDDAGAGEVDEAARGSGLRRAIGELLICPYCLGLWIAAALTAALIVAPKATRWTAAALTSLTGADLLQIIYKKAEDLL
jgi:hypothetical protein